jgi:hypothetical protein
MGVVPMSKAGVGSAVNDATRLLGGTLGVAIIGSVYASLYGSGLAGSLPSGLAPHLARAAHSSVGTALIVAEQVARAGHPGLAAALHHAASTAFFHGFSAGNLVAAGVAAAGALMALALLPAQPAPSSVTRAAREEPPLPSVAAATELPKA